MYTIQSAQYANAEHTAAVIQTEEAGSVLLGEVDTPDEWAAMLRWGTPTSYQLPALPAPSWSPLEFLERFTQSERIAIRQAAAGNTPEAMQLADWLDLLRASMSVVSDDARTIAGMQALVDAGLLTAGRRDEILSDNVA